MIKKSRIPSCTFLVILVGATKVHTMGKRHLNSIAVIGRITLLVLVEAQTPTAAPAALESNNTDSPKVTPPPETSIFVTLLNNGAFVTVIVLAVLLGIIGFGRDKIFGNRFEQMRDSVELLGASARRSFQNFRGSVNMQFRQNRRLHKALEAAQHSHDITGTDGPLRSGLTSAEALSGGKKKPGTSIQPKPKLIPNPNVHV